MCVHYQSFNSLYGLLCRDTFSQNGCNSLISSVDFWIFQRSHIDLSRSPGSVAHSGINDCRRQPVFGSDLHACSNPACFSTMGADSRSFRLYSVRRNYAISLWWLSGFDFLRFHPKFRIRYINEVDDYRNEKFISTFQFRQIARTDFYIWTNIFISGSEESPYDINIIESNRAKWTIGINNRRVGAIHSDVITAAAADSAIM